MNLDIILRDRIQIQVRLASSGHFLCLQNELEFLLEVFERLPVKDFQTCDVSMIPIVQKSSLDFNDNVDKILKRAIFQ
jgi:hypothetical protein